VRGEGKRGELHPESRKSRGSARAEEGISVSEEAGRDRHQMRTLLLVIGTLVLVLGAITAVVALLSPLDKIGFLRFPLGFYLLAQGLLIGIVAACFWSARVQEGIDTALSEGEEP
jgi:putative solute:sodium symporter small subunit